MNLSMEAISCNLTRCDKKYSNMQEDRDFVGTLSTVAEKVDKQQDGEMIGFGTIMDASNSIGWIMQAKYAEDSTQENPIIYVETNYGGKKQGYNININDIDPRNASKLEMFALSSYADDQGFGSDSTFGTYNTIKCFYDMAVHNNYLGTGEGTDSIWEQFKNEKLNWQNACKRVMELLYNCGDLIQYNKGLRIMNMFTKYPIS